MVLKLIIGSSYCVETLMIDCHSPPSDSEQSWAKSPRFTSVTSRATSVSGLLSFQSWVPCGSTWIKTCCQAQGQLQVKEAVRTHTSGPLAISVEAVYQPKISMARVLAVTDLPSLFLTSETKLQTKVEGWRHVLLLGAACSGHSVCTSKNWSIVLQEWSWLLNTIVCEDSALGAAELRRMEEDPHLGGLKWKTLALKIIIIVFTSLQK
jgi:hypothetical protein